MEIVLQILAAQQHVSLTTDMWTSRAGNGYISLICHCVSSEFEMHHSTLLTRHLPGVHDHVHIAEADLVHLECSPEKWRILEDICNVLKPFKVATEYLSGE